MARASRSTPTRFRRSSPKPRARRSRSPSKTAGAGDRRALNRIACRDRSPEKWIEHQRSTGRRAQGQARPTSRRSCIADYRGIDVPTVTALRDDFRKVQCHYRVIKNTLVKIAVKGTKMEPMQQVPRGPDRVICSTRPLSRRPRSPRSGPRTQEKFVLKGGYFEGRSSTSRASRASATMPGKDELRAMLLRPSWRRRPTSCAASARARRTSCTCSTRAKRELEQRRSRNRLRLN